jgi:hypothetical protein
MPITTNQAFAKAWHTLYQVYKSQLTRAQPIGSCSFLNNLFFFAFTFSSQSLPLTSNNEFANGERIAKTAMNSYI